METIRGDWNRQRGSQRELKVVSNAATNFSKRAIVRGRCYAISNSQQRELHSAKGYLRLKVSSFFTVY